jgi:hypothetical protein
VYAEFNVNVNVTGPGVIVNPVEPAMILRAVVEATEKFDPTFTMSKEPVEDIYTVFYILLSPHN